MIATVGAIVILINLLIAIFDINKGVFLYIILAFVSPQIHILNSILSYELLVFFPLFIIYLLKKRFAIRLNKVTMILGVLFFVVFLASIISYIRYDTDLLFIPLQGQFRYFLMYILFYNFLYDNKDKFHKILLIVLTINVIIVSIQLLVPESVNLFYTLYSSYNEYGPLYYIKRIGRFHRGFGTFSSPVYLSIVSSISLSYFLAEESLKKKNKIIGIIMSIYCGLTSLTKTFIIASPIIILMSFLSKKILLKRNNYKKTGNHFIVYFSIIIISYAGITFLNNNGFPIYQYLSFLLRPLDAFRTRYSSGAGNLNDLLSVFWENPIIGVGVNNITGEFIGDSGYYILLHHSGIIGTLIFLGLLGFYFMRAIINRNSLNILLIMTILLVGFSNSFFRLIVFLTLAYITIKEKEKYLQ